MDFNFNEEFSKLPPEERQFIYTRGIMATLLENDYHDKSKKHKLMKRIRKDKDFKDIIEICTRKELMEHAKEKILNLKTLDEVMSYADFLKITSKDNDYELYSSSMINGDS